MMLGGRERKEVLDRGSPCSGGKAGGGRKGRETPAWVLSRGGNGGGGGGENVSTAIETWAVGNRVFGMKKRRVQKKSLVP